MHKKGFLTTTEKEIVNAHTNIGYSILKNSNLPLLKATAVVAHENHEKWNGEGYPRGLKGDEIHIYARIVSIADVFDALGSKRSYKEAMPIETIVSIFKEENGKSFEPKLVELFLSNINLFVEAKEKIENSCELY